MGLFSNKKKPCPICGSPTPRLFPGTIEGIPICRACESKRDMPRETWMAMTVEGYRQYIAFHEKNQALRDTFEETYRWYDHIRLDIPKKLFRLDDRQESLAIEASCIKSFRILEGDNVLFESSPEGLKCYETDVPARVRAAEPAVSQFKIQYEQYQQMKQMQENMKKNGEKNLPYLSEPSFSYPILEKGLMLELTLEHPYWNGTHRWYGPVPKFDDTYPSIHDFLRSFERELKQLHELAVNLMNLLGLDATEIPAGSPAAAGAGTAAAGGGTAPTAAADPVAEIQRYKTLLDSGAITQEEFDAKKRQLLGI